MSGEITLATKKGIKSSAKKLFKKETEFEKLLEKQVNDSNPTKRISRVNKYKADEFIIETSNIFATCSSCSREFVMLEEYLKTLGKKVKFVVKSDNTIDGMGELTRTYPEIKKYQKLYKKLKKKE